MKKELLIGCGSQRVKVIHDGDAAFENLTTLDINPNHGPDVVHDLCALPLPFDDDEFDEIHAYEVLEHTGAQGDYKFFFAQFSDFWRILKPDGKLFATVPRIGSPWLWGDPSHTRAFPKEYLLFLSQPQYDAEVGITPMSDFRYIFHADFDIVHVEENNDHLAFVIQAIKPSRQRTKNDLH